MREVSGRHCEASPDPLDEDGYRLEHVAHDERGLRTGVSHAEGAR